jgi:hypothetical protein
LAHRGRRIGAGMPVDVRHSDEEILERGRKKKAREESWGYLEARGWHGGGARVSAGDRRLGRVVHGLDCGQRKKMTCGDHMSAR